MSSLSPPGEDALLLALDHLAGQIRRAAARAEEAGDIDLLGNGEGTSFGRIA